MTASSAASRGAAVAYGTAANSGRSSNPRSDVRSSASSLASTILARSITSAGLIEDRRGLHHLDHEGRASAREIVGRPNAREQPVDNTQLGAPRRHETAHLGEDRNQRVLPQEGRLAGHVRTGEQPDATRTFAARRGEIAIIGDERAAVRRQRLL